MIDSLPALLRGLDVAMDVFRTYSTSNGSQPFQKTLGGPKFHRIANHLPQTLRDFGPAGQFSTEKGENIVKEAKGLFKNTNMKGELLGSVAQNLTLDQVVQRVFRDQTDCRTADAKQREAQRYTRDAQACEINGPYCDSTKLKCGRRCILFSKKGTTCTTYPTNLSPAIDLLPQVMERDHQIWPKEIVPFGAAHMIFPALVLTTTGKLNVTAKQQEQLQQKMIVRASKKRGFFSYIRYRFVDSSNRTILCFGRLSCMFTVRSVEGTGTFDSALRYALIQRYRVFNCPDKCSFCALLEESHCRVLQVPDEGRFDDLRVIALSDVVMVTMFNAVGHHPKICSSNPFLHHFLFGDPIYLELPLASTASTKPLLHFPTDLSAIRTSAERLNAILRPKFFKDNQISKKRTKLLQRFERKQQSLQRRTFSQTRRAIQERKKREQRRRLRPHWQ